jgi:hypothetical protein
MTRVIRSKALYLKNELWELKSQKKQHKINLK